MDCPFKKPLLVAMLQSTKVCASCIQYSHASCSGADLAADKKICLDCPYGDICSITVVPLVMRVCDESEFENQASYGLDNVIMMAFCPACYWKCIRSFKVECPENIPLAIEKVKKDLRLTHDSVGRCGDGEDLEVFEIIAEE